MISCQASQQPIFASLTGFTYNERGLLIGGAEKRQKKNPVTGLAANTGLRDWVCTLIHWYYGLLSHIRQVIAIWETHCLNW